MGLPGVTRAKGFTLIELIVVMAIAGLIMAIAPPLVAKAIPGVELKATAKNIAASLRYVRSRAIYERGETVFVIDTESREYFSEGKGKRRKIPEGIELSLVSAESDQFKGDVSSYRFFPSGGSTGGRITLSNDNAEYKIDIDWLTGRVRILD